MEARPSRLEHPSPRIALVPGSSISDIATPGCQHAFVSPTSKRPQHPCPLNRVRYVAQLWTASADALAAVVAFQTFPR